jgi:hypothetical protein
LRTFAKLLDLRFVTFFYCKSSRPIFFSGEEKSGDSRLESEREGPLHARGRSRRGGAMPVSFAGAPMDLTMLIENSSRELLAAVDGALAPHARIGLSAHAVCVRAPDTVRCTAVCVCVCARCITVGAACAFLIAIPSHPATRAIPHHQGERHSSFAASLCGLPKRENHSKIAQSCCSLARWGDVTQFFVAQSWTQRARRRRARRW